MEFVDAMMEDLKWFGFDWQEGPDCGGPFGPYAQSERRKFYLAALEQLRAAGLVYPCTCSRKDILTAARAPHAEDEGRADLSGHLPHQERWAQERVPGRRRERVIGHFAPGTWRPD